MTVLSGFPEWLPEQELVQQHILRLIREEFELHGFVPLHTRAVEPLENLLSQGETDKEIYGLHRLNAPPDEDARSGLGLHYDLTVPFARFVNENRGKLLFPYRRYQIQPAWRGERPQLGRYREFIQADADVIVQGDLGVRYDAEMVALLQRTMAKLPIPRVKLLVNNRKVLEGFYRGLGVSDVTATLRAVDKLAKVGPGGVLKLLETAGHSAAQAQACVDLAGIEVAGPEDFDKLRSLGVSHALFEEGLGELATVLDYCRGGSAGDVGVVGAMHLARGFDYYTGTVVEGVLADHPELGSVSSGGRYDNLAAAGSNLKLPGVGVSIGVTRILAYCFHLGLLQQSRKTTAQVLVAVHSEETRAASESVAAALRARRIACLVSDAASAYGKQIKSADRLGIQYVWFPANGDQPHQVKDVRNAVQAAADLATWVPDPASAALTFAPVAAK